MWEKVYCKAEKPMIDDDFFFKEPFCWEDPGLSLRNMGLIKQLRTLEKSIQGKVADLETEPVLNNELIMQERALLEATQKQLRRVERKTFYSALME